MRKTLLLLAVALVFSASISAQHPTPAPTPIAMTPEKWREDLAFLAAQLERTHQNAFHAISKEEFARNVASLDARIPTLENHQVIVEFMRIVALIGDGHTGVRWGPLAAPGLFPVEFYVFDDGVFVRKAAPEYSSIVGAKLVKVGGSTVDDATKRLIPYIWCDNEMGIKSAVPWYLTSPRILHAVGLSASKDTSKFTFLKDGREFEVELKPTGTLAEVSRPPETWLDARDAKRPIPAWLKEPRNNFRYEMLPESKTFYIQFNAVQDKPEETVEAFFGKAFQAAERSDAERLVLDIRLNGGGNNYLNRPITIGAIKSKFNAPGKFFVIIGRETFSAAQNTVNDLEKYTSVVFVGEPTGARPNHYGDARPIILPNSQLRVQASTLWWQDKDPRDTRRWTAPTVAADLTFADYREGRDPALEAILRYKPQPTLSEIVENARRSGNVADFLAKYKAFKADPLYKYVESFTIMNRVGHFLLGERRVDDALEIFKLNAADNAGTGAAYQSLGDAYAIKGDKAAAIQSYEKALALDPRLTPSMDALKTLRR